MQVRGFPILAILVIALMLAAGCTGIFAGTDVSKATSDNLARPLMRGDGGHAVPTTVIHGAESAPPTTAVPTTTRTPVSYGTPVVQTTAEPISVLTVVVTPVGGKPVTILGCTPGKTSCGGSCVNLSADPANCGSCGVICPANLPLCKAGICVTSP